MGESKSEAGLKINEMVASLYNNVRSDPIEAPMTRQARDDSVQSNMMTSGQCGPMPHGYQPDYTRPGLILMQEPVQDSHWPELAALTGDTYS